MDTPYYLIHKDKLNEGIAHLKNALGIYWPNAVIGYSFKTNSLPWILCFMKEQGCYAEVVSENEYELSEYMGFEHVIYNGPVKGKGSFFRACKAGHIVNLDSYREVEWVRELSNAGVPVRVGVRVNFDLESKCPGEAQGGTEGGRFGFGYENGSFKEVVDELFQIPRVEVSGIHLHCSSKTRSLNIYRAIADTACQIHREYHLDLEYVDVGGGFFGGLPDKPQYEDYLQVISDILKEEFNPHETVLVVEPGTSLICPPIDYMSTVLDVKKTNRNCFVLTDGSRIHVDPLMSKKGYFYHVNPVMPGQSREQVEKQVITGFTCMENDRLFEIKNMQALKAGDQIVYEKVGAYTMCLSPLFSGYFPAVYLENERNITCVREKWGVQEYIQQSFIEEIKHEHSDFKLWN